MHSLNDSKKDFCCNWKKRNLLAMGLSQRVTRETFPILCEPVHLNPSLESMQLRCNTLQHL